MRSPVVLALVAAASCGGDNTAGPTSDSFAGSYSLVSVAGIAVPGIVFLTPSTGAYVIFRVGGLAFPDIAHVVVSSTQETHSSATAPAVVVTHSDTFDLGRLPSQANVLGRAAHDTIALIRIPSSGRLTWDFRSSGNPGTYLYARQ